MIDHIMFICIEKKVDCITLPWRRALKQSGRIIKCDNNMVNTYPKVCSLNNVKRHFILTKLCVSTTYLPHKALYINKNDLSRSINQVLFIFNVRELSVNRNDLQASTLVGMKWKNPVLDPLTVQHLDNQLCIYFKARRD